MRGGTHPPLGFPSSPLVTWSSVHLHPFISSDVLPTGQMGATLTLVSDGASSRITFSGPAWILLRISGAEVPFIHSPSTLNRTPSLHSISEESLNKIITAYVSSYLSQGSHPDSLAKCSSPPLQHHQPVQMLYHHHHVLYLPSYLSSTPSSSVF